MSETPPQSDDLDQNALNEFKSLIEQNLNLSKEWKILILELVSNGFPDENILLTKLTTGGDQSNASPENLEDKKL